MQIVLWKPPGHFVCDLVSTNNGSTELSTCGRLGGDRTGEMCDKDSDSIDDNDIDIDTDVDTVSDTAVTQVTISDIADEDDEMYL